MVREFIAGCALALSTLLPVSAFADVTEIIDQVEKKYAAVEVMKADFTQTTKSPLYGDQEQKGQLTIKRPAKMRWDFSGDGKRFVTDGSTMWIYDPAAKQVIRYNDFTAAGSTADSLLQSLDKIGTLFDITEQAAEEGQHVLDLKPKEAGQMKSLVLTLDESLSVRQVVLTDAFDSVTILAFDTVVLDAAAPDELFTFEVPDGVTVIDAGSP